MTGCGLWIDSSEQTPEETVASALAGLRLIESESHDS
jgi:hypothetical protein